MVVYKKEKHVFLIDFDHTKKKIAANGGAGGFNLALFNESKCCLNCRFWLIMDCLQIFRTRKMVVPHYTSLTSVRLVPPLPFQLSLGDDH